MLETYGDVSLLPAQHLDVTEQQLRSAFGEEFSKALLQVTPKTWHGPIRSGYGLHLVYVYERQDSAIPEWRTIKPVLLDDMEREARKAAKDLFYTEILRQYQIVYRGEVLDLLGEKRE
jgi:parvulin-like peptidyl-prolyl isomerase